MTRAAPSFSLISLLALLPAAGFAAFGGWQLSQTLSRPVHEAAVLPPVTPAARHETQAAAPVETIPWAPLFGVPAPPPEPTPVPEPIVQEENPFPDDEPFLDAVHYTLRGLVYQGNGLGFAMLETDDGIEVVRQGDILPGGETVLEVAEDGIEIGIDDDVFFVGFDETAGEPAGTVGDYDDEFGEDPAMIDALQGDGDQPYGFGLNPYGLGTVGRQSQ